MKLLYTAQDIVIHHALHIEHHANITTQVLHANCLQTITLQCTLHSNIYSELDMFKAHWEPHTCILLRFFFGQYESRGGICER
jgi:hypothetical protein